MAGVLILDGFQSPVQVGVAHTRFSGQIVGAKFLVCQVDFNKIG